MKQRRMLVLVMGLFLVGCGQQKSEQKLNVFVWPDYITEEIAQGFGEETGIQAVVTTYDSNESLLARLQAGATGYDVIMPSDYMASIMIQQGLLEPLDKANIPNLKLVTRFRNAYFDPEMRHAVPYDWGTAGIAYDSAIYPNLPQTWAVFWDESYRGRTSMLDDMRETLGATLKLLGYSVNTRSLDQLEAAKQKLIEAKPLLKRFDSQAAEVLLAGDAAIAHAWSGDAFRAATEKASIRYFVPKEGSTVFIDTICIPKGAPHKKVAEQFINYMLKPEVAAKFTNHAQYATTVDTAREFVDSALRDNPIIYLPEETFDRLEWIKDLAEFLPNYDRAWTEVKASQ